jgi:ABC-type oligopeptide transport system substrate-binding subunit
MRAYELLNKEELQVIISESTSFSEVLTKIGLVPSGSNHVQFKKYVEDNNFDISEQSVFIFSTSNSLYLGKYFMSETTTTFGKSSNTSFQALE